MPGRRVSHAAPRKEMDMCLHLQPQRQGRSIAGAAAARARAAAVQAQLAAAEAAKLSSFHAQKRKLHRQQEAVVRDPIHQQPQPVTPIRGGAAGSWRRRCSSPEAQAWVTPCSRERGQLQAPAHDEDDNSHFRKVRRITPEQHNGAHSSGCLQVLPDARLLARAASQQKEPLVAVAALVLLADLATAACRGRAPDDGPAVSAIAKRILGLLLLHPDHADRVVEAALRVRPQKAMAVEALRHPAGKHVAEVLVQLVNHGNSQAASLLAEMVEAESSSTMQEPGLLYKNDIPVLVDILMRELPLHHGSEKAEHAACLQALLKTYRVARQHRCEDVRSILADAVESTASSATVKRLCSEALQGLRS